MSTTTKTTTSKKVNNPVSLFVNESDEAKETGSSVTRKSNSVSKPIGVPKYDGTMSVTKYLRIVDEFTIEIKKERYTLLLAFINDWLKLEDDDTKMTSLIDFKNMDESVILKDKKHNRDVLRKYQDQIVQKLNPDFDIGEETDSDDIKDKYIIYFVAKSLTSIGFSLSSRTVGKNKKVLYSIRMK